MSFLRGYDRFLTSSLVFVPCIETVLAIVKLVRTKDMFGYLNVESSYLCLLVYFPSRIYTLTLSSLIYTPYIIIHSYVPPIFACMII